MFGIFSNSLSSNAIPRAIRERLHRISLVIFPRPLININPPLRHELIRPRKVELATMHSILIHPHHQTPRHKLPINHRALRRCPSQVRISARRVHAQTLVQHSQEIRQLADPRSRDLRIVLEGATHLRLELFVRRPVRQQVERGSAQQCCCRLAAGDDDGGRVALQVRPLQLPFILRGEQVRHEIRVLGLPLGAAGQLLAAHVGHVDELLAEGCRLEGSEPHGEAAQPRVQAVQGARFAYEF